MSELIRVHHARQHEPDEDDDADERPRRHDGVVPRPRPSLQKAHFLDRQLPRRQYCGRIQW